MHVPSRPNLGPTELSGGERDELIEHSSLSLGTVPVAEVVAVCRVVTIPMASMSRVELTLERAQLDDVAAAVPTALRFGDLTVDPRVCATLDVSLRVVVSVVARLPPATGDSYDFFVVAPLPLERDVRGTPFAMVAGAVPIVVWRRRATRVDHNRGLAVVRRAPATLRIYARHRTQR